MFKYTYIIDREARFNDNPVGLQCHLVSCLGLGRRETMGFLLVCLLLFVFSICLLLYKNNKYIYIYVWFLLVLLILDQDNMPGFGYHKTHHFQLCDGERTLKKKHYITMRQILSSLQSPNIVMKRPHVS